MARWEGIAGDLAFVGHASEGSAAERSDPGGLAWVKVCQLGRVRPFWHDDDSSMPFRSKSTVSASPCQIVRFGVLLPT